LKKTRSSGDAVTPISAAPAELAAMLESTASVLPMRGTEGKVALLNSKDRLIEWNRRQKHAASLLPGAERNPERGFVGDRWGTMMVAVIAQPTSCNTPQMRAASVRQSNCHHVKGDRQS
jgi:hypothetical protein